MKKRNYPEYDAQAALVKWARIKRLLIHSIPNGGKKSYMKGERDKKAGLTAGVSDLFLAEPSGPYHGYYIEMKAPKKKPTVDQEIWLSKSRSKGYKAEWFDNWEMAKLSIEEYLGKK